jgi:hypothetical protein
MTRRKEPNRPEEDRPDLPDDVVQGIKQEVLQGIGYGRPPEHSRFKKGQSGNPKGRPRRTSAAESVPEAPEIQRIVLDEAKRPVTVKEGGRTIRMPAKRAVTRAEIVNALRGSAYAQKHVLEQTEKFEREEQKEIARKNAAARAYVATCHHEIDDAKERGLPVPDFLPNPDDIIIEPGRPFRVDGPVDEEELARVEELCWLRSQLLLQHELESRMGGAGSGSESHSAALIADVLNQHMYTRFRLDDVRMIMEMMRNEHMTKRELLKEVYRGWRRFGLDLRRGQKLASFAVVRKPLEWLFAIFYAHLDERIDLAALARGEGSEDDIATIQEYLPPKAA